MNETQIKEFQEAVKPLAEWISKHGDPHVEIIVKQGYAEILQGHFGVPLQVSNTYCVNTEGVI